MQWKKDFINLFENDEIDEAYKLKHKKIPSKLYKYLPFNSDNLKSTLNNEIWFSIPKRFNDPFDCMGIYWDSKEMIDYVSKKNSNKKVLSIEDINKILKSTIQSLTYHIKVSCFTEDLYSMPMWANYSENHSGFCIEYDFSKLSYNDNFSKYLFPVAYESNKYDITELFKIILNNTNDHRVFLLFFLMQTKHISWNYEKEWRIFNIEHSIISGSIKCPVKPTAIYLGFKCNSEDTKMVLKLKEHNKIECPIYSLKQTETKFFDFEIIEK